MTDNDSQLAAFGQQVLDQLIAAYAPDNDPELALAVLPGKAVQDPLSHGGAVNPLLVSQWLHAEYDDPLLLRLATCTPISGAFGSGIPATAIYALAAQHAVPAGDPNGPAAQRVAAMIAAARVEIEPDPAVLPMGCEPSDWATEAGAALWRSFETTIGATGTTGPVCQPGYVWREAFPGDTVCVTPETRAQAAYDNSQAAARVEPNGGPYGPATCQQGYVWREARPEDLVCVTPQVRAQTAEDNRSAASRVAVAHTRHAGLTADHPTIATASDRPVDPDVWKLRALPEVPEQNPSVDISAILQAQNLRIEEFRQQVAVQAVPDRAGTPELDTTLVPPVEVGLANTELQPIADAQLNVNTFPAPMALQELSDRVDPSLVMRVLAWEAAPAVETATTTTSNLHVQFEHCMVTITRTMSGRPWWQAELLHDDGWYIPGMHRGELVPESSEPGTAHCLPRALLLVRGLEISGTWTAEARATLGAAVPAFGPFLLAPTKEFTGAAVQQTTVLGLGTQVIGVLATPLTVLPPLSDPALG